VQPFHSRMTSDGKVKRMRRPLLRRAPHVLASSGSERKVAGMKFSTLLVEEERGPVGEQRHNAIDAPLSLGFELCRSPSEITFS
jgi:hypothetical protein